MIDPEGLKFSRSDGSHPGVVIGSLVKMCMLNNSSQMIEPKRLKFQGLVEIIRKFGEDYSKTLPMGLFFSSKLPG